jgi:subtilisin-like proprotein convertase family protein
MAKILKKIKEFGLMAGLALASWAAHGQIATNSYTFNIGATLPDNSVAGFTYATNLAVAPDPISISNLLVSVDISGGRNSTLYVYLKGPNGALAILLNSVGVSQGNSTGYKDTGVDVTFSDSATNGSIHFYQNNPGYPQDLNANGQITGLWQPDGENISPQSPAKDFTGAQTAMLSSFQNTDPNGTWTLFAEEEGHGGPTVLNSLSLEIVTVAEPPTVALCGLGGITLLFWFRRRRC